MMRKIDSHLKIIQYAIFFIFFSLLYMQFRLVGVQYDDYGYYSLNYGAITPHYGTEFTLSELFRFLGEHYNGANGRLLYFGIWLLVYKLGGGTAVQLTASLTVTFIWYLLCKIGVYSIGKSNRFTIYGAVILCICYGGLSILLHQHGTYWFAAFFTYYMPLIPTLLFVLYYAEYGDKLTWRRVLSLSLLVFTSAWSGETWSVGIVSLMLVLNLKEIWCKKRFDQKHFCFLLSAGAGLFLLLKSPGIKLRAGDSEWGISNLNFYIERIKAVFTLFFSESNMYYFLYFLTGCFILALILFFKRKKVIDLICAIAIVAWEVLVYVDCTIVHRAIFFVMLSILLPICRYYYLKNDLRRNMLLFAAFMSVASLAAVPTVGQRIYIPFEVCSFIIVFDACYELYEGVIKGGISFEYGFLRKVGTAVLIIYVLGMSGISIKNSINIYNGYKENSLINEYNDNAFSQAKEAYEQGEEVSVIYLKKYPNDLYATTTYYQDPWFKEYIARYYDIPIEIEYIYE